MARKLKKVTRAQAVILGVLNRKFLRFCFLRIKTCSVAGYDSKSIHRTKKRIECFLSLTRAWNTARVSSSFLE